MSYVSTYIEIYDKMTSDIDMNNLNDIFKLISKLKKKSIWSKQLNYLFQTKINKLRQKIRNKHVRFTENQLEKYKLKILGSLTYIKLFKRKLNKIVIRQISQGGNFMCILSINGDVYSSGRNSFGQLGIGKNMNMSNKFEHLNIPKCDYISCGYSFTLAKTINNCLYSWGAGQNGRLGHGNIKNVYLPTKLPTNFENILYFYSGSVHVVLLTRNGNIYSWGKKYYTGHNSNNDVLLPQKIIIDNNNLIKFYAFSVGIGGYHTIAITEYNEIYTWGHNQVGQLGISPDKNQMKNNEDPGLTIIPVPTKVISKINNKIIHVTCGWGHTIILCKNGSVWTCGRNCRGQLGIDKSLCEVNKVTHYLDTLTELLFFRDKKIIHVFAGGVYSGAVNDNGDIYMWGNNSSQNIPTLNKNIKYTINPTKINISKPSLISCGVDSTIFLH